jgi:hypothetical protein
MHASEYFTKLANMAGINPDNEGLQELIGNESLQNIEINDEIANTISSKLMTMDSAKANSELNKHFRATILNGLDAEIEGLVNSFELPDDVKTTISNEQSSFKKVPLLVNTIKELEKQKAGANATDTNALNQQIAELNDQIVGLKSSHDERIATINETWAGKMLQSKVSTILNSYNYALPVSTDTNVLTAQTLVNQQLNSDGLKIVDNGSGLSLKTSENTDYFVNNAKVDVKSYIDNVLGTHKLLKVNESNVTPPTNGVPSTTPTTPPPSNDGGFAGEIDKLIRDAQR